MKLHRFLCILLLIGTFHRVSAEKITVQINSGNPVYPFPQFKTYTNPSETLQTLGSIPQQGQDLRYMEQVIRDAYQIMMNRASYTGTVLNGVKYISYEGDLYNVGMSETYGFALQAAAYLGDKTTFDGLWLFFHDNFIYNGKKYLDCSAQTTNANANLPSLWPISSGGTDSYSSADANITLAMAVAYRQWGNSTIVRDGCGNNISYKEELRQLLHDLTDTVLIKNALDRITSGIFGIDGYVKGGSTFGEATNWAMTNKLNDREPLFAGPYRQELTSTCPSYFREFHRLTQYDFYTDNWTMNQQYLRGAASSDWIMQQHYASSETAIPFAGRVEISATNAVTVSTYAESEDMQWAWRNALDYVWHGNPTESWDPVTHLIVKTPNTTQRDMARRYSTFLNNPQAEPWSNSCTRMTSPTPGSPTYTGVVSLVNSYSPQGDATGQFSLNFVQGTGASSAVVGQDLAMMAKMFRQCELLWDGTAGYLDSKPQYFHEWFRLLGMLTLTGNMQAPSKMIAEANVRLMADFAPGTGKLTVIARNYGTLPSSGTVQVVLPKGVSPVVSANYSYQAATRTVTFAANIGKTTSDTLTIVTEGFATAADKNATISFTPTGKTVPMSATTLRVEGKDTYTPMHVVTATDSTLAYGQIVPITNIISLPQGGYLYGGTPGVSFQAASKNDGTTITIGLSLFHDANMGYIDLKNYRYSYYFYYDGTENISDAFSARVMTAEGFTAEDAKITFEKIEPFSNGTKRANARMVVSFPSSVLGTNFLLDTYEGLPTQIHRGGQTKFFAQIIFNKSNYANFTETDLYSYDANAIGSSASELALINVDHSSFDGTAKTIDRLSPSVCAASAKTTSNVVVEEFDGYQWRVVAGQLPMGDVRTTNVDFVDTLPANLDFIDLNNFLSTEILGVKPKYDATTREISYHNPAVPYGSEITLNYLVKSTHNSPVNKTITNTAIAKIGTENKRNNMEITLLANPNLPKLAVSVTTSNAAGEMISDGHFYLQITGGTAPYTLTDGTIAVDESKGLPPGIYSYLLTDADGGTAAVNFTILANAPLSLEMTSGDDLAVLGNSFTKVDVTGGEKPYSYLWNSGETTAEITGIPAGRYTVTVTDARGITASKSSNVRDSIRPEPIVLTTSFYDDIASKRTSSAMVEVTGGTAPYSYFWSNGETTAEITNITAGEYSVTVTDANGKTATKSITVTDEYPTVEPLALTISFTDDVNTQGTSTAKVEVAGGTAPYLYNWNNGETTAAITNLTAGEYSVTVTDTDGTVASKTINVADEYSATTDPLALTMNQTDDAATKGTSTASVTVTGGTAPYSYIWNNGETTAEITSLVEGEYTVTVTDADGTVATKTITVTDEYPATTDQLVLTTSYVDDLKTQGTSIAYVEVSGGTAPYSYKWSNGETTAEIINLVAGEYTVTVTDADGSVATKSVTVADQFVVADPLVLTLSFTDDAMTQGTSTAKAEVTGGTAPYSYIWNNGGTTAQISQLEAGEYFVLVYDADGTIAEQSIIVADEYPATVDPLVLTMNQTDDAATKGTSTASVTVTGGTAPYSYKWNNGETTAEITSLTAGDYTVTVTDADGSIAIRSITVTDEYTVTVEPLVLTTSFFDDIKTQGTTTAKVEVTGGTAPYSYNWSNGETIVEITSLVEGEYTVTVTDADGTVATKTITVTDEYPATTDQLVLTTSYVDDLKTQGTSIAYVEVSGGTAPYLYEWSNGETTAEIINLVAGEYSVTVTDAENSEKTAMITVEDTYSIMIEPLEVTAEITQALSPSSGGSIDLTVSGGVPPYRYAWSISESETESTLSNVPEGTYTVTITDAIDSIISASFAVTSFVVGPIEELYIGISETDDKNVKGNSSARVFVINGTEPYTFFWSNGALTPDISNIPAGLYSVTVVDANHLSASDSVVVTDEFITNVPEIELTVSATDDVTTLGTSTAKVAVTGGAAPYSYKWSNGETTAEIINLVAGEYTVTVTDADGSVTTKSVTVADQFVVADPLVLTLSFTDDAMTQGTSSAKVSVTGGVAPYLYLWENPNNSSSINTAEITNLIAGEYTVTVTDARGITATQSITVTDEYPVTVEPLVLTTSFADDIKTQGTSSAKVEVTGGTSPYSYEWSNGETKAEITSLVAGEYSVTVTDADGSVATKSVTVTDEYPVTVELLVLTTSFVDDIKTQGTTTAKVEVTGGVAPYLYLWENPNNSSSINTAEITNLIAGEYTVTVTDARGITATQSITVTDEYPVTVEPLVLTTSFADDIKTQGTSSAKVEVTGGTSPYSYEWSNGETKAEITSLVAGEYSVTVTDADGSVATKSVTVTDEYPVTVEPLVLTTSFVDDIKTQGTTTAKVEVTGGVAPYLYLWENPNNSSTINTAEITNLIAGEYTVTVTDARGITATQSITVTDEYPVTVEPLVLTTSFADDIKTQGTSSAKVEVTGGTSPYSYEWSNGETKAEITSLVAGEYSVTVTDADGSVATKSVTVTDEYPGAVEPLKITATISDALSASTGGRISLNVTGGITPYSYKWSNNATDRDIFMLPAGEYTVTVTDAAGATKESTFSIKSVTIGYSISGTVTINGAAPAGGELTLMKKSGDNLEFVQSQLIASGTFTFTGLSEATYILLALPSGSAAGQYLPSYYKQSSQWADATGIPVISNLDGLKFELQAYPKALTGSGVISGNVVADFTINELRPYSSGNDISVPVYLMQEDEIIAVSYTTTDGSYSFANVPIGTYRVEYDVAGNHSSAVPVLLTQLAQTISDLEIDTETGRTQNAAEQLETYPQPAATYFVIEYPAPIQSLTVVSSCGFSTVLTVQSDNYVNISSLPSGSYSAHFATEQIVHVFQFVKQ